MFSLVLILLLLLRHYLFRKKKKGNDRGQKTFEELPDSVDR